MESADEHLESTYVLYSAYLSSYTRTIPHVPAEQVAREYLGVFNKYKDESVLPSLLNISFLICAIH